MGGGRNHAYDAAICKHLICSYVNSNLSIKISQICKGEAWNVFTIL